MFKLKQYKYELKKKLALNIKKFSFPLFTNCDRNMYKYDVTKNK